MKYINFLIGKLKQILSIPFSKIAANLLPAYFINYLSQFKYLGVICAILILKRPLTDFYWLNINEDKLPFLGVIELNEGLEKTYKWYAGKEIKA